MKEEKHYEIINEVIDEVASAIKDPRGLIAHQRRLAFSISLGAINLLELYFHKHGILKQGVKMDHRWFTRKKEKIIQEIENQTISPIKELENIDEILTTVIAIEEKRNDLTYGSPATEELLQQKINLFFKLRSLTKC